MAESSLRQEAAFLPDDVLTEILLFLPAKSLLRFRSVCKNWCSLIRSPRFVSNHHNRSKSLNRNEPLLVIRSVRSGHQPKTQGICATIDSSIVMSSVDSKTLIPFSDIDMDFWSPSESMIAFSHCGDLTVLGPCNGIICITDTFDIILCNPATREFKTLPFPSRCDTVGFGYDLTSDDYKIARIFEVFENDSANCKVEIYNLSTDTWRNIDVVVPMYSFYCPFFEKVFNGAFHWYISEDSGLESIVVFDMKDEVFRLIGLPDSCSYSERDAEVEAILSVWNDSLALLNYNESVTEMYLELWVMKEYGVKETWIKIFRFGPLVGIRRPLGILKDREFLLERCNGQLVSCDIRSREIKESNVRGIPGTLLALLYTENLLSVEKFRQIV